MIKNILDKSNILEEIFGENDFEFLKINNEKQQVLQEEIKLADKKRDKVVECIKNIEINENEVKDSNPKDLREYVNSAECAFESINNMIRNLNEILEELNEVEDSISDLIQNDKTNNKEDIEKIKQQLEVLKNKQIVNDNENMKYNLLVNNFLYRTEVEETENAVNTETPTVEQVVADDDELKDNLVLKISEKYKRVYLPYTKSEVQEFLKNYPNEYKSAQDVIDQEFVTHISIYNKHPVLARFREAYSLSRNREMKSSIDSFKFAMDIMFKSEINPTIIAAVKSQKQLETYIECLENNTLDNFKCFEIIFEVNPI